MSVSLTLGTEEFVNVLVKDATGQVDDLAADGATSVRFDVKRASDDFAEITDQAATTTGMIIQCLVDTTGFQVEPHNLYAKFTIGSENVVLGPFPFYIKD